MVRERMLQAAASSLNEEMKWGEWGLYDLTIVEAEKLTTLVFGKTSKSELVSCFKLQNCNLI